MVKTFGYKWADVQFDRYFQNHWKCWQRNSIFWGKLMMFTRLQQCTDVQIGSWLTRLCQCLKLWKDTSYSIACKSKRLYSRLKNNTRNICYIFMNAKTLCLNIKVGICRWICLMPAEMANGHFDIRDINDQDTEQTGFSNATIVPYTNVPCLHITHRSTTVRVLLARLALVSALASALA